MESTVENFFQVFIKTISTHIWSWTCVLLCYHTVEYHIFYHSRHPIHCYDYEFHLIIHTYLFTIFTRFTHLLLLSPYLLIFLTFFNNHTTLTTFTFLTLVEKRNPWSFNQLFFPRNICWTKKYTYCFLPIAITILTEILFSLYCKVVSQIIS